jgi:hypothetical protein
MDEEDGFSITPAPRDNPILSFAREHVTLLATIVAALIFALRCVAVSGGDVYVASILVAETSTGDAIRALLFTVLPILLYVMSIAAAVMASGRIIKYGLRDPANRGAVSRAYRQGKSGIYTAGVTRASEWGTRCYPHTGLGCR